MNLKSYLIVAVVAIVIVTLALIDIHAP